MSKYFIGGVADVTAIKGSDILFRGQTLTNSSIATAVEKTEVRGGKGNARLGVYFHTSSFTANITEALFNLKYLAANVGKPIEIGGDAIVTESVTLTSGGNGAVAGTPVAFGDAGVIGWAYDPTDPEIHQTVTFTGSAFLFPSGTNGQEVCVKYLATNSAATSVVIPGDIIPDTVTLFMEVALFSAASKTAQTRVGKVQIEVPAFVFDGNVTLDMTANGVSNVPLTGTANAVFSSDCAAGSMYAKITVIPDAGNWYDNLTMLAFADPTPAVSTGSPTYTIITYGVAPGFAPYLIPSNAGLTFVSGTPGVATVSSAGVITRVSIGSSTINVKITAKPSVEGNVIVTSS